MAWLLCLGSLSKTALGCVFSRDFITNRERVYIIHFLTTGIVPLLRVAHDPVQIDCVLQVVMLRLMSVVIAAFGDLLAFGRLSAPILFLQVPGLFLYLARVCVALWTPEWGGVPHENATGEIKFIRAGTLAMLLVFALTYYARLRSDRVTGGVEPVTGVPQPARVCRRDFQVGGEYNIGELAMSEFANSLSPRTATTLDVCSDARSSDEEISADV